MKNLLILSVCSTLLACGGGGGGSGSSTGGTTPVTPNPTPTPTPTVIELPTFVSDALITDIASTDLNNDGAEDLILVRTVSNYGTVRMQALINDGDGSFTDHTDQYFSSINNDYRPWVEKIYLADLNNDGQTDIIAHHDQSHWDVSVGLHNAVEVAPMIRGQDGQFSMMDWHEFQTAGSLIPIDIDNDGDIDLMSHRFVNFDSAERQVIWDTHINNFVETGNFSFTLSANTIDTLKGQDNAAFIYSPIVADLNSDGFMDIFYAGPKYKGSFVDEKAPYVALMNQANSTFNEDTTNLFANAEMLTHARELHVADFNGDDFNDLVITSHGYDGGQLAGEKNLLLLAGSDLTYSADESKQTPFNYKGFTHSSAIGDLDNDGDIDIVFSDITGEDLTDDGNIHLLFNDSSGNFTKQTIANKQSNGGDMYIVSTHLADVNGDGSLDIVLGGDDSRSPAVILLNDGSGNF